MNKFNTNQYNVLSSSLLTFTSITFFGQRNVFSISSSQQWLILCLSAIYYLFNSGGILRFSLPFRVFFLIWFLCLIYKLDFRSEWVGHVTSFVSRVILCVSFDRYIYANTLFFSVRHSVEWILDFFFSTLRLSSNNQLPHSNYNVKDQFRLERQWVSFRHYDLLSMKVNPLVDLNRKYVAICSTTTTMFHNNNQILEKNRDSK